MKNKLEVGPVSACLFTVWLVFLNCALHHWCHNYIVTDVFVFLFPALISGQRVELLGATVGGSVLVTCKLPVPTRPKWFYWQEDGTENILIHCEQTCQQTTSEVYRNRVTVFASEFGSGNISIKLHSVTAADDQKSFWVMASFKDRRERRCNSTLQVSGKEDIFLRPDRIRLPETFHTALTLMFLFLAWSVCADVLWMSVVCKQCSPLSQLPTEI